MVVAGTTGAVLCCLLSLAKALLEPLLVAAFLPRVVPFGDGDGFLPETGGIAMDNPAAAGVLVDETAGPGLGSVTRTRLVVALLAAPDPAVALYLQVV